MLKSLFKATIVMKLLLYIQYSPVLGQDYNIKLIDEVSEESLSYVHYRYDKQQGISDENGMIWLKYTPEATLFISSLEKGKVAIHSDVLQPAIANGTLKVPNGDPISLQPVTIMALRPGDYDTKSMTLTDNDKLSHDAGAILSQIPSISSIRKSGSYGWDPVLRGYKYDQLNLVIDGVQTATAACPNRMDPPASQIPLNQIKKVEVYKGPHSLRYGPAIGGTINFISEKGQFTARQTNVRLSSGYESNGNIFRTEGLVGLQNEKLNFNLNGAWSQGEDYSDGNGDAVPAAFKKGSFGGDIAYKINANQSISLSATRNLARYVDFAGLPMDLKSDDTWLLNVKHQMSLPGKVWSVLNTSAFYSYVDHSMDNLSKNMNPRMVNAETHAETRTAGGRVEAKLNLRHGWTYLGADLRIEQAEGTRTREMVAGPMAGNVFYDNVWQNGMISRSGIFSEYHLQKAPFHYILSVRLDVNNAKIQDEASEFVNNYEQTRSTQVNPSLSLGTNYDINNHLTAGLWVGRAQRSGSLTERYINYFPVGLDPYELLGNPDLKPEINNQVDLNFSFKKSSTQVKLGIFGSYLENFITSEVKEGLMPRLPNSPGVRQFINIDQAFISGFEASWQQKLFAGMKQSLGIIYSKGDDKNANEPLPEIPPLEINYQLRGVYLKEKLQMNVSLRQVLAQNRVSESFAEMSTPSFTTVDFAVNYQIHRQWRLSAGVQNIFDASYYEHLNRSLLGQNRRINAPGRNFAMTLSFDLNN